MSEIIDDLTPAAKPSGKKGLGLCILQILREHSDYEHPMQQKSIIDLLHSIYQMEADRKTVRHNVNLLLEMGYPIEHAADGWYYEHEFTDPELCLLIDSLPDSLPDNHRSQLVSKIKGLGSRWFAASDEHKNTPEDQELLYTLDVLRDAIHRKRCVVFHYGHHSTDKKLHLKTHHTTPEPRDYVVSPYRTVIANGHYMLLCSTASHDTISHYRVDRIRDIHLGDKSGYTPVSALRQSLADVASYLSQRPFMFSDDSVLVRFRITRDRIDDVLDSFGMDVRFVKSGPETVEVETRVSPIAMKLWALQYGEKCEVLAPEALRIQIAEAIRGMATRYGVINEENQSPKE